MFGSRMTSSRMTGSRRLGAKTVQSVGSAPGRSKLRRVSGNKGLLYEFHIIFIYIFNNYNVVICVNFTDVENKGINYKQCIILIALAMINNIRSNQI